MASNVLVVSKGSTFMIDAIIKNLKQVGLEADSVEPKAKDFNEKVDNSNVILVYLGDYIEEVSDSFVYLKDACIGYDKSLNVIGDNSEIEDLEKIIPDSVIEHKFYRPLDMKQLVITMEEVGLGLVLKTKKKSILLVDDDATFLKMAKDWLSERYRVTIVNSGMQAITYMAKNTPDLILLDYEMPVTSGPQVLEMIRSEESTSDIPVIFLTGKDDKESVTNVLSLKPQGYFLKSTGKEKLLKEIDDFFEKKKALI